MAIEAGQMLLHYRLVEKIGEGGMGSVWKATDTTLDREVAIKILPEKFSQDPQRLGRFKKEAKAIAALNHPNLVTIHSVNSAGDVHFITMELVQGKPLSAMIPNRGMSLEEFVDVAAPLVEAVSVAHGKSITHRDLKPDNIMVSDDGSLRVLDFGLAKLGQGASRVDTTLMSTRTVTQQGHILGTAAYMSPEQAQGKAIDHRTDIFSLGIIFYEMMSGERPFHGDTPIEIISSILKDTPRSITESRPDLPHNWAKIIARCLEKDPDRRYQTMVELRAELEAIQTEGVPLDNQPDLSIAVLPFADMSAAKDQEYFCEGMAEEIINALTKIPALRVTSRTSAFQIKGLSGDIRSIGRRLGVNTVLEGSVRKAADRLRIAVQLISVAEDRHLWSERYDRELKDVFAIQDEIAQNIVQALEITLSANEKNAIRGARPNDIKAYDFYLRGRKFFHGQGKKNLDFARQMFSRAVEIDPTYALAYAGIADCYSFSYWFVDSTEENLEHAHAASQKALDLDSGLAEAHASRALVLSASRHFEEAEEAFETAIRLDPQNFEAYYFYARSCFERDDLQKAARLFERASEVRPEDYQAAIFAGIVYGKLGREQQAASINRRAIVVTENHLALNPDDVRALYLGAMTLLQLGETARGVEWTRRALSIDTSSLTLYNAASNYSVAGHVEEAIDCLEKAVAAGFSRKEWIENDLTLEKLREHPRFRVLLDGLK